METKSIVIADAFIEKDRTDLIMRIAGQLFKAGAFMADCKNAEQVFAKILAGTEMGMKPMEAMNSLYIVNGKITMWGAALSKRLRENGWKISYADEPEKTTVTISKEGEEYTESATVADVKAVNSKAITFAKKDKLRWHALGRLVRFHVPEIMGGTVDYVQEEVADIPQTKVVIKKSFEAETLARTETAETPVEEASEEQIAEVQKSFADVPAELDI